MKELIERMELAEAFQRPDPDIPDWQRPQKLNFRGRKPDNYVKKVGKYWELLSSDGEVLSRKRTAQGILDAYAITGTHGRGGGLPIYQDKKGNFYQIFSVKDLKESVLSESELEEGSGDIADTILRALLGQRARRDIHKSVKGDQMTQDLSDKVWYELRKRLEKGVDKDFEAAIGRLRMAQEQRNEESARNLIFKAANALEIYLPHGFF